MCDGAPEVVFDAKFRLEPLGKVLEEDTPLATAKRSDLYKMHTYRDALGVRAAVALYPGTETLFYSATHFVKSPASLADIINGNVSGIGALPFKPGGFK
jgi:predicted component of viral defense system (DUF524 family)